MIVPDWLAHQAAARPDHPALEVDGVRVSFRALAARVEALARRLVGRGARIATLLPNSGELVALVHAVPRAGATLVLLDARLTPTEAARQAAEARVDLVVGGEDAATVARAAGAAHLTPEALAAGAPAPRVPAPVLDLDAAHTIVFTSGTSGVAKPVVLTAANHLWSAAGSLARLGVDRQDRWLACLPLTHVGGLAVLVRSALAGTTVVLHRRFDAAAVARALVEERITMVSLVPTMLARVLDHLEGRPPALRCVLVGGAGTPPALAAAARARGLPVALTYGLTEAASQVATLAPDEPVTEPGEVGAPLWPTEVRVSEAGEILVRGPTVAPACLAADGWLHTGDAGRLLPGGRLVVRGRCDDVIVTGGENVDPAEVEAALLRHPDIAEAAVAGVPDPEWGEAVAAWVVPRGAAKPTLDELRAACRPWLAAYKLPRRLTLVAALPRTASGKVRRAALVSGADARGGCAATAPGSSSTGTRAR